LQAAFNRTEAEIRDAAARLRSELDSFDPTLGAAMAKSQAKMLYQVEKNRRKAAREALRRDALISQSAAYLANLVYPHHVLQERYYSVLPFIAQHGFQLVETLGEHIHRGCPDHLLLTV
jgi:bacillithiol synthase